MKTQARGNHRRNSACWAEALESASSWKEVWHAGTRQSFVARSLWAWAPAFLRSFCFYPRRRQRRFQRTAQRRAGDATYLRYNTPSRRTAHRIIVPALVNGAACSFCSSGETDGHARSARICRWQRVEAPMLVAMGRRCAGEYAALRAACRWRRPSPVAVNCIRRSLLGR